MQCYYVICRTNLCSDWSKIIVHAYNNNETCKMVFLIFERGNNYILYKLSSWNSLCALETVLFQNSFPQSITFSKMKMKLIIKLSTFHKTVDINALKAASVVIQIKIPINLPDLYQQLKILYNYVILLANVSVATSLNRSAVN